MISHSTHSWEERYRDLAGLPLPGPALVIDVRKGSEYEPPLVWNLATELDDFVWEMEQHTIYRWRRLKHCIALLKLSQLPETGKGSSGESTEDFTSSAEDFTISDPRGTGEKLRTQGELIHALREKIELVRANRAGAIFDREERFPSRQEVDPQRPVVTVCFMADASDPASLTSAATYARWLKEARLMGNRQWALNHQGPNDQKQLDDQEDLQGRDIRAIVMCFNVDHRIHSPRLLFKLLQRADQLSAHQQPALDKTILLYCFGDNSVRITNQMQAHQIELILYVLLLSGWEMLNAHKSYQHEFFTRANGDVVDCWPLDLIGVSSLEYSARWGTRWLDYSLVEYICSQFLSTRGKQREQELSRQSAWIRWHQANTAFIQKEMIPALPVLQILSELEALLGEQGRAKKLLESAHLSSIYKRLTKAAEELPQLITSIQDKQLPANVPVFKQIMEIWVNLQEQTTCLPALLLLPEPGPALPYQLSIEGLLPRAQWSSDQLTEAIRDLHDRALQPLDLDLALNRAQDLAKLARYAPTRPRHQKQSTSQSPQQDLRKQLKQDLALVQNVILAQVELALLEQAGLYDPEKTSTTYRHRLKVLVNQVQGAARSAKSMRERAYERLQLSLSEIQPGSEMGPIRLDTHSRDDLLKWPEMDIALEKLKYELQGPEGPVSLLGYSLLALLGGADPQCLLTELCNRPLPQVSQPFGEAAQPRDTRQEQQQQQARLQELQGLGTVLISLALCEKQVLHPATQRLDLAKLYRQKIAALALEPSTLTKVIEQFPWEKTFYGPYGQQRDSSTGFLIRQEQTFEALLAALLNNEYIRRSPYAERLAQNDLFTRMVGEHASPEAIFHDLESRNHLLGQVAPEYRTKSAYLLVPGNNSTHFMQNTETLHIRDYLQILPFPDIEKMIYLRVHHIAYPEDELIDYPVLPSPSPIEQDRHTP